MPKTGISVTLDDANLLWLKSRTAALKGKSLSDTLDSLVTAARTGGLTPPAAIRSIAGTVDIASDDPDLDKADDYVRHVFGDSISRPIVARDAPSPPGLKTRGSVEKTRGSVWKTRGSGGKSRGARRG